MTNFHSFKEIPKKNKEDIKYINSGFNKFDNKVGGFQKGQVSIWSGLNASGKTNFLTQECIEYYKQNYRTAIFSGEMPAYAIQNMIYNQYAGSIRLTKHTQKEFYYLKEEEVKSYIDDIMDDYLFIYKNEKGSKVANVLQSMREIIKSKKIDVLLVDNLMALDLRAYDGDKNEKQKHFILELTKLAEELNVHVHVVMHPRKSMGFLRKEDIAGSQDLSNAAHNVFIVHRVNKDFKSRAVDSLGTEMKTFFEFDGVIEVCKNRNEGVMDWFMGMYFDRPSKKFSTTQTEKKYM